MIKQNKIQELAIERINELDKGLFIVEITISRSNQIQVELDCEKGNVSIEDCISVSRNIEHNLDREKEDFELQVSSSGLTSPFRVHQQYIKNVGQNVKVLLQENNKSIEGEMIAADKSGLTIETTTKERIEGRKKKEIIVRQYAYDYNEIKETKLIISFKK